MRTVIAGGTVVSAVGMRLADVVCEGEQIAEVTDPRPWGANENVIDARGRHVLPGLIDPHVHARDPGLTDKEDFAHATRAAAAGGLTTILDMPNTTPAVTNATILAERADSHSAVAHVDFGLWGLAADARDGEAIRGLAKAGAVGVKVFWGYYFDARTGCLLHNDTGAGDGSIPPLTTGGLWELFQRASEAGLPVAVHCEDRTVLDAAARLHPAIRDYQGLLDARPDVAETVAAAAVIELARDTGTRAHIVHVSSGRTTDLVRQARTDGIKVTAETCPHYLLLTADEYPSVGPRMKVYPPVRQRADQEALWLALRDDALSIVASDHAPHAASDRDKPFGEQPAGAVGVETMVPLMLDQVTRGRIALTRMVDVLSETTARTFGLYPRKGAILAGSDADLTIVDLAQRWKISDERLHSKSQASPWHGRTGVGSPVVVILRGRIIARNGIPIGQPTGRFVAAGPA